MVSVSVLFVTFGGQETTMIAIPKSPFMSAVSTIASTGIRPLAASVVVKKDKVTVLPSTKPQSNYSLSHLTPRHGKVMVTNSFAHPTQVRLAHSDTADDGEVLKQAAARSSFPNFDFYRRPLAKAKNADEMKESSYSRKSFTYLTGAAGAMAGIYGGKEAVQTFLGMMSPAADVVALAKVEVDLSEIPEGKNVTVKWRGKPLFIRHRTAEEYELEQSVNLGALRDPQHDADRVQKPEWLVIVGVCTHLGCIPVPFKGDWGGYYCPCHGSHYDASGRIRKGPAPLNLEVPVYEYMDENTLVIG